VTDQINHLIAQSGKVAFEAGRQAERDLYKPRHQMDSTTNRPIGRMTSRDFVITMRSQRDLEDTLADLRKEGK
jgi:hypothetical protein